jgi:uncharacterized iron-regulated membrane protein
MNGSLRQSMSWLHTWTSLVAGWLLLVVCITGSAAYYRDEISLWMQPEWHAGVAAQATPAAQAAAARLAVAQLQRTAPDAASWIIDLPQPRKPYTGISWTSVRGQGLAPGDGRPAGNFASATLDGAGQLLPEARDTRGGGFFAVFHFTLHYVPVLWGRWIVSICTMLMLVALISGVITHRRFFADFFTFRPGKGQRSWLDAHNALGVLALPFHTMICYSGLVTLMLLTMPWAVRQLYPDNRNDFVATALPQAPRLIAAAGAPAALADIAPLMAQASAHWQGGIAARVTVQRPNDAAARYIVQRHEAGRLSNERQSLVFNALDGTLASSSGDAPSAAAATRNTLIGLHLGRFAEPWLRGLLFMSALGACAMMATGMLLWTVKARQRKQPPRGLRLAESLNIATIAALPAAMALYFWLNRLLPADMAARPAAEINGFFIGWGVLAAAALVWPARAMWMAQLMLAAALFAGLPVLNLATAPAHAHAAHAALLGGGTGLVAATDAGLLLSGALLAWAGWRLRPLPLSAAARWRWQIAARTLTAIFGCYALAALASSTLALLAAVGMPRVDAALTGMLLSFIFYAIGIIWTFSTATLYRAWAGLLLAAALLSSLRLLLPG